MCLTRMIFPKVLNARQRSNMHQLASFGMTPSFQVQSECTTAPWTGFSQEVHSLIRRVIKVWKMLTPGKTLTKIVQVIKV